MAAYPYQPVYYPPQPIVAPPQVIYAGGAQPVVHTTTVVHKDGKSYGGFKGYSKSGKRSSKPSSKKSSTFNLLTINKTPKSSSSSSPFGKKKPKSSSSSGKKPSKSSSSSSSSSSSGKKHRSKSRKSKKPRARKPEEAKRGDRFGPQIDVESSDAHVLRSLLDKMGEVGYTADSAVRRFFNGLFSLCRDHGGVLPTCVDVPLDVQYMISRAVYSRGKEPMRLTFVNEAGERFEATPARPVVDNARTVSVSFALPPGAKTSLDGRYAVEVEYGGRTFVHHGEFAEHSRTIHGDGMPFHWLINMYEGAHSDAYYKFLVPIPTLELLMVRSRDEEASYNISTAKLTLDAEPRKHSVSLPITASDVAQVPGLLPRPYAPYKAYMRDNATLQQMLHASIEARLGELMADSPNKWAFRCSGGARAEEKDHRVFLGGVSHAVVAYAVVNMIRANGAIGRLNDPELIKEALGVDANGRLAIEVVTSLYDKYHAALGRERTHVHQDFPSVLQLLAHTSGLPASRSLRCEEVRAYYLLITDVLGGKTPATPIEMSYDKREEAVLKAFSEIPAADNDVDVEVGPTDNTFESFLLAMFVRRFSASSPMALRPAGDILNTYVRPSDFKVSWGGSLTGASAAAMLADPLVFSSCATTTFSGLTSHARALTEELAAPSRTDSVFFNMLSTRYPVVGEDADVVHSLGWMQQRVNNKLDLLFVGSTNNPVDTVVLAIVPQLAYFAVFHEMSVDFDRPLTSSAQDVVEAIAEVLDRDEVRAQYESIPDRPFLAIPEPSRVNKSWDTSFLDDLPDDFAVTADLPGEDVDFFDPFVSQMQQRLRSVRFVRDDERGVTAWLEFSTGEHVALVYDPRRNGYYVRLFDEESALGKEVVVTNEYIQYNGRVYIRREDFEEFSSRYIAAYDTAAKLANADVFNTKLSSVVKSGTLTTTTPTMAFSLESNIGHGFGRAVLGGMAAGATAAALSPYAYGALAPGYPYGYPYYAPGVYVPPYVLSPYRAAWVGPGYYRHRRRRFHR